GAPFSRRRYGFRPAARPQRRLDAAHDQAGRQLRRDLPASPRAQVALEAGAPAQQPGHQGRPALRTIVPLTRQRSPQLRPEPACPRSCSEARRTAAPAFPGFDKLTTGWWIAAEWLSFAMGLPSDLLRN